MDHKEFTKTVAETVKDPKAKLIEEFYSNYSSIQILREFSSYSKENESDKISIFLNSHKGRKILTEWRKSFEGTFNALDSAVAFAADGHAISLSDWQSGVEASARILSALADIVDEHI